MSRAIANAREEDAGRRSLILFVLFIARTVMGCQFQTVGSTAPFLSDVFAVDFTQIGTLIGLYKLPGIIIALPGGVLGQRFGAKRLVLAGLALMALGGAAMGVSGSFVTLSGGRLVSGVRAMLINVLMTKMVADWFADREIVTAMAILIASWPLGLALGLWLFAPLAATYGVGAVMQAGALLSFISLVLVAIIYRSPSDQGAKAMPGLRLTLNAREWLAVSFAGSVWATFNVGYIVLISFLPGLFTGQGWSFAEASHIVSFLGWALIPSVPLAGYVAERLNRPNLFLAGGFVLAGLSAAALPFVPSPLLVFAVLVCVIGAPAGPIMALPASALRPEKRAGGTGVYFTWYYPGMAALPGLAGMARDATGSAAPPALFAAGMMALALLGLIGFRAVMQTTAQKPWVPFRRARVSSPSAGAASLSLSAP